MKAKITKPFASKRAFGLDDDDNFDITGNRDITANRRASADDRKDPFFFGTDTANRAEARIEDTIETVAHKVEPAKSRTPVTRVNMWDDIVEE